MDFLGFHRGCVRGVNHIQGLSCASITRNIRGHVLSVLLIQSVRGWLCQGFHRGLWTHGLWEKRGALGEIGTYQGVVG